MTVSNDNKFEENYILSSDIDEKEKLLNSLIGGSPQYFYYNVLHLLNVDPTLSEVKNKEKYQKLMKDWNSSNNITAAPGRSGSNYDSTQKYKEIDLRQKLLSFRQDNIKPSPLATSTNDMFEELRYLFGLSFTFTQTHHQSTASDEDSSKDSAPLDPNESKLKESTVDKKTILDALFTRGDAYTADYINYNSYEYVFNNSFKIPEAMEKRLISKLKYPIVETDKMLALLDTHKSSFGSLQIHNNLTLEQMEKYIERNPQYQDTAYVRLYLEKLIPSNEYHDWETSQTLQDQFYQAAFKFVSALPISLNSFKLLVYHHFIKFQISTDKYDNNLINKYFELPRDTSYSIVPDQPKPNQQYTRFNEQFTGLKAVSQDDDEKLITSLLKKLLFKETSIKNYQQYFRPRFLELILAESKLTGLDSKPEQWIQMVDNHSTVQALKDRVDIEFSTTNKSYYHPDDEVVIECYIKNVSTLLVKVFEISTYNYYKNEQKAIDSNINLDGLIASQETKYDYHEATPIEKSLKKFTFPQLSGKRGVYVIEFIGNGKSSRSMIQKGDLHFIVETSPVGQIIKVIDQDSIKVTKSSALIDGNTYKSNDETGDIKIPFSSTGGYKNIILSTREGTEGFSALKKFTHATESYSLSGGIFVENGSLLQGEKAPILVSVKLFLDDTQLSNNYLEETSLTITSTDNSESPIVNSKEIKPFKLNDRQETVYLYKVQENLSEITVRFEGKVRALSRSNALETLSFEQTFRVNSINQTSNISEYYLESTKDGYQIRHLGKGGDPFSCLDVSFEFQPWITSERVYSSLKTDRQGIIKLGNLTDVESFNIHASTGSFNFVVPKQSTFTYPSQINCKANEQVRLPYFGGDKQVSRQHVNFFKLAENNLVVSDALKKVSIDKSELVLDSLLPGRYLLILSGSIQSSKTKEIYIDVVDGQFREGFLIGSSRIVSYNPSNVCSLGFEHSVVGDKLEIQLRNYSESTRVHIESSYFVPTKNLIDQLPIGNPLTTYSEYDIKPKSLYFNGRALGDEINYILNRKTSKKVLPGNSLKKPSLLVQPWSIGKTSNSKNSLKSSESYDRRESMAKRTTDKKRKEISRVQETTHYPYLEFLSHPTILLSNLVASADGKISVDVSSLIDAGLTIQIVAVDNDSMFSKNLVLDSSKGASLSHFKDTKLTRPLDSTLHYKEEKLITPIVPSSAAFEILNVESSKYTVYDSLDKVLSLMKTLNKSYLVDFSFVSEWESLSYEKKKEKFSKYTCHELNFFVYKKDKEFFNNVVLPLVQTKGYKTFLDYYLVGDVKKLEIYIQDSVRFGKLNCFEKILLADLFPDHAHSIASLIKQKSSTNPIKPSEFDTKFKIALNQLDTDIEGAGGNNDLDDSEGGDYPSAPPPSHSYEEKSRKNKKSSVQAESSIMMSDMIGAPGGGGPSFGAAPMQMRRMAAPMAAMSAAPMAFASMSPPPPAPISRAYEAEQLYAVIEKTEELAETYYYKQLNSINNEYLIPVSEFWVDYANHLATTGKSNPFVSKYIAFTCSNFTESMMALSVLDIPFNVPSDNSTQTRPKNGKLSMKPTSPIIVFHQELVSGELKKQSDILVTQHFFDPNSQYIYTNEGEQEEVYISDQFLVSKVYGAMVVVANLSSKQKKLDVLLQIPKGSIAVGPSPFVTSDKSVNLSPYSTTRLQYYFYFPAAGQFTHFPAHVSEKQNIIASVAPFTFNVVLKPTIVNQLSWEFIANHGTLDSIVEYLEKENLCRIEWYHLYHRYNDKKSWERIISLLKKLKFYEQITWSYSIHHKDFKYLVEYLSDNVHSLTTKSIDAPLVYVDPFQQGTTKFLEYSPLVNSRNHLIGSERKILNNKLSNQYYEFCNILSFKLNPSDTELLSIVYYLLLQDRFEESIKIMKRVGKNQISLPKLFNTLSIGGSGTGSGVSDVNNNNNSSTVEQSTSSSSSSSASSKLAAADEKEKKKKEKEELKLKEKERKQKEKDDKKREKDEKKLKEKEEKKKKDEDRKTLKKKLVTGDTIIEGSLELPSNTIQSSPVSSPINDSPATQSSSLGPQSSSADSQPLPPPTSLPIITSDDEHDEDEHEEDDDEELIDISEFNAPNCLPEMTVQFDYLLSYLDFFNPNPLVASENSKKYENYPIQRWNSLFKDLKTKVDQVTNKDSAEIDYENEIDRERRQNKMASNEPTFDVSLESNKTISVNYSNLVDITVSYYVMDIEHLFSTNPFVQQELGHFLYVSPNKKESFLLNKDGGAAGKSGSFNFKIPTEFSNSNVVIDVVSAQIHHNITVYSNNLAVYITEKVGQLRVVNKLTKKAISKAYIKVYSKNKNGGAVEFFKDGYTDIAGYFDYSTVSTLDISNVDKLSILILSNQFGAVIKDAKPPGF